MKKAIPALLDRRDQRDLVILVSQDTLDRQDRVLQALQVTLVLRATAVLTELQAILDRLD